MPTRPGSACTNTPGCRGIVRSGRCSVCGPKRQADQHYDQQRGTAAQRGYDRRWQRLRLLHLRAHPLCAECLRSGLVTQANEVDHILPKRLGGDDSDTNLQSLCKPCHSRKTMREIKITREKPTMPITIITGPPGSGKTTYVEQRAQWGDLIVDVDAIYSALSGRPWYEKPAALLPFVLDARDAILDRLHGESELRQAWIITSEADHAELQRLKARYSAKLLVLEVDPTECLRRIAADPRRANAANQWQALIANWWEKYTTTRP